MSPSGRTAREVIEGQKALKENHPWVLYFGGNIKENFWPIRKLIWKACEDAKVERFTPHTLRHTFASQCAMAGVDLRTLAELLGHKTLDMVEGIPTYPRSIRRRLWLCWMIWRIVHEWSICVGKI